MLDTPTKKRIDDCRDILVGKLPDPKVTAAEMLTLYSEAILSMDKNPNIPQLFRDIFNFRF